VIASQVGGRPSIGAWSWSGSGIPVGEVIDRALGIEGSGRPGKTSFQTPQLPITARELEVARLVAEGLSNRQVAQRLVLSARTVDGHVQRILGKLGVSTRTGIATWMLEHADDVGRT
jgi:DNA-binding NarL/FixJ family response regulator